MMPLAIRSAVLFFAGVAYWLVVSRLTGAPEPWDSAAYWTWAYPGLLVLSAIAGPFMPARAWLAGVILTLAQLPVVWISGGPGSLWLAGALFAFATSLPAAVVSVLASRLAGRFP